LTVPFCIVGLLVSKSDLTRLRALHSAPQAGFWEGPKRLRHATCSERARAAKIRLHANTKRKMRHIQGHDIVAILNAAVSL